MPKMKDNELATITDGLIDDSVSYNSEFMDKNREYLRRYNQEQYGDEDPNFSQVIASDVKDTVDSDMTSMVRVFLGSGDVMIFEPITDEPAEVQEAESKTKLINYLALKQPGAYKIIHGWLKDAEIQKMGVVHYYVDEVVTTKEEFKKGMTMEQATLLIQAAEKLEEIDKVEIVEKEEKDGKFNIRFKATVKRKQLIIKNIPNEDFLLTRNTAVIEDAIAVGHDAYPTRSELVASGMSEKEVNEFPTSDGNNGGSSTSDKDGSNTGQSQAMKDIRWRDEGGDITDTDGFKQWSAEKVHQVTLYALIDYDGDGIAERRRVVKIGNKIVENDAYDHIPYAVTSCILEPHKAIGNGRASLVIQDQSVNTELDRAVLDNIYDVGNQRTILGNGVNHDDFYDDRKSGVVRMKSTSQEHARDSVHTIQIPFIGDQVSMVKQSRDQSQAQRTGTMLDSQGLEADQLNQETATRFSGIEKANEAKIELVARNHAEVGFRKLYDGLAWTLQRFIDEDIKVRVNGKPLVVNPSTWRFPSVTVSQVGLGAGSGEKAVQQLTGMFTIQQMLKDKQSLLVDDSKIFNTLDKMTQAQGFATVSEFFNDPDIPQDVLQAKFEQLVQAAQLMEQQIEELSQKNPLAEAAEVEARGKIAADVGKHEVDLLKESVKKDLKELELLQKKHFKEADLTLEYTKLELDHDVDIPGVGQDG